MKNILQTLLIGVCSTVLVGCVSTVTPYDDSTGYMPGSEGESRLWFASKKFDDQLSKSGQCLENTNADAYLQGILDKLFPELKGTVRVKVLKQPVLNAMALPNGSIYVNSGLLATLENEAQLATVLAHEGIHFLNKHSAKQREFNQQAAGWHIFISLTTGWGGLLSELGLASAVSGHSREHETEADLEGYKRLRKAGYAVHESYRPFEHMLRESKSRKDKPSFFFASHPALEARIANFKRLSAPRPESFGFVGQDEFMDVLGTVRHDALIGKLEQGQYDEVIALLEEDDLGLTYGGREAYYLGQAYRLRNQDGDLQAALTALTLEGQVTDIVEEIHKERGLVYLEIGDIDNSQSSFESYKGYVQGTSEELFADYYLRIIEKKRVGL